MGEWQTTYRKCDACEKDISDRKSHHLGVFPTEHYALTLHGWENGGAMVLTVPSPKSEYGRLRTFCSKDCLRKWLGE